MAVAGRFGIEEAEVYDGAIRRMVPGYELLHRLVRAELTVRLPVDARVLVVGAGTGAELSELAATQPGWTFTAVDPAAAMLDVARTRAEREGFADRVSWHPEHLPDTPVPDPGFDGAVMVLVAHFLPVDGSKQTVLAGIAERLRAGAPLVMADLATGARPGSTRAGVRRRVALDLGSDEAQVEVMIERMWASLHPVDGPDLDGLLRDAGFGTPEPFFQALGYRAWTALRRPAVPGFGPAQERAVARSFLSPAGRVADWRVVLAYEAIAGAGVLDALPGRPADLADRCGLDPDALRAALEMLVAAGVLAEDTGGADSGGGAAVVGTARPAPAEHVAMMRHAAAVRRWAEVLGPRLRDRTAGPSPRPLLPAPAGLDPLALAARRAADPVLDACLRRVPHARRALDLGGGHGEHALALARRGLRVTLQDLPPVVAHADRDGRLSGAGVELHPGDLTVDLAAGPFDLVLCATVTNMFGAEVNRDLARRLQMVLAPSGVLAIVTYLGGRGLVGGAFGLQMLAFTDGGAAFGEDDHRRWLAEAGYGPVQVEHLEDPGLSVLTAPTGGRAPAGR